MRPSKDDKEIEKLKDEFYDFGGSNSLNSQPMCHQYFEWFLLKLRQKDNE